MTPRGCLPLQDTTILGKNVCTVVRQATNDAEPREIQRFRYGIWVDELGYDPSHAHHANRTLAEPLGRTGCGGRGLNLCFFVFPSA
jgi:hypothetical protein